MTNASVRRRLRTSWVALGLYAFLALLLSWPVRADLSSRIPGTATWAFDESTFVWNIWYFKHALLDLRVSPLHSGLIWYPLGIDLILYTYNFFNALIALPLQLAFNLPAASNLSLLFATTLSGFGTYLLACYVLRIAYCVENGSPRNTEHGTRNTQHGLRNTRYGLRNTQYLSLAAFLAGLIYAFASNRAVYAALGHYDMVTTQWLPFYALYLLKTLREPKLKNAVLAGLFFALAALAEMIFASLLALFTAVIVLAAWRPWRLHRSALGRLALALAVAALIWAPVLVPIAREFLTGDYALTGWGESVKLSADLVGLVTPTDLNPLATAISSPGVSPGEHWTAALRAVVEDKSRFSDINTVFLGYITLALALLGAWTGRKRLGPWIWSAAVFGVLALGPLLQIGGRYRFSLDNMLPEGVTFPLPFTLLHFIPFVNGNRAPNRNSALLMLALAVLAGYGAAWLLGQMANGKWQIADSRRTTHDAPRITGHGSRITSPLVYLTTCLLAVFILAEHLAVPPPTTDAAIPAVYRQIAAEPGDFAIMQLPLGWRNSFGVLGSEQTNLQYFQAAHGKPMLGGNISRAPAYKMDYFARIPLFRALTDLEMYQEVSPETDAAARAQAADLMALYDVRYLVTTPPIPGRFPYQDTWQRTEDYALDVLPLEKTPVWAGDGYKVYRVIQPTVPNPFHVDLGASGAEPYVGGGWDYATAEQPYGATGIWATDTTADLYLPLDGPKDATLRLALAPLAYDAAPPQKVSISVNGVPVLKDQTLAAGWQVVEARAPAAATHRGPNRVTLDFAWAGSPREVFPDPASRAMIGGTGVVSPVNLDVHSFDEAFISLFGPDKREVKASAGRRGYNVTVIDPRTGKVLDAVGFDTAANPYEAEALAAYLAGIPQGRIVAVATRGDAGANLTQAAVEALRGLGSRAQSPADLQGMAHALVGLQGAAPGTAAEEIQPGDAFVRVAGDFRRLAAALDWAELVAGN
jgi:4-amino-4-deoxy-L-arabinose transferase-like glycosyltransferase